MYLADYHTHSRWSRDGKAPMTEMVRAAIESGLQELCCTDHLELIGSAGDHRSFDWVAWEAEHASAAAAASPSLTLRRGFEVGEVLREPVYTEAILAAMPPVDFLIASKHKQSRRYDYAGLKDILSDGADAVPAKLADYLEEVAGLIRWGRFDVLGHLTLPVRYLRRQGCDLGFDGYEEQLCAIFRALIASGKGIEVNTDCGRGFLPEERWLRLYRSCGGELITLGSDAHRPEDVGRNIRDGQALLKACGFRYFATYQNHSPIFHVL